MKCATEISVDRPIYAFQWTPNTKLETMHWHRALEIGVCNHGEGTFFFGKKTFDVHAGDVFMVNNVERHIAISSPKNPCFFTFVYFDPGVFWAEDEELLIPFSYNSPTFENRISHEIPIASQIGGIIQNIFEEQNSHYTRQSLMIKSYLSQVCVLLMRHFTGYVLTNSELSKSSIAQMSRIKPALDYIHRNFREPIELDDVAREMCLSPSRARHLIKEVTGQGFKDYLLRLRVNEARSLLSKTETSVTNVCLMSGFQSLGTFYRSFKQRVGMTPQEYRSHQGASIIYM